MTQHSRRLYHSEEKSITTRDGLKIYYEVSGSGKRTLFFVHGLGGDVAAWDEIRIYFQQLGYKTVAVDLRAHGYSEHPNKREGYELTEFAEDLHEIVLRENIKHSIMIGHCFGGMVVYTYAMKYPKTLSAIVLVNASYRAPYMSQRSPLKLLIHPIVRLLIRMSPAFHKKRHVDYTKKGFEHDFEPFGLYGVIKHNSLKTFLSVTDVVFSLDVLNALRNINVPTLIVSGTEDTIYPQKMSREMHQRMQGSVFQSVEGANHPIVLNNPMEVAVAIHRYLLNMKLTP